MRVRHGTREAPGYPHAEPFMLPTYDRIPSSQRPAGSSLGHHTLRPPAARTPTLSFLHYTCRGAALSHPSHTDSARAPWGDTGTL